MFDFLFRNAVDSIDVNKIEDLLGKINLIDVREPDEYREGHLPTAKNIPLGKIAHQAERQLDKSKEYHIICYSGARSSRACSILKGMGFNVVNVAGGTGRYRGRLVK